MSLSRLALRVATMAALRGRTAAGDAVADSVTPSLDGVATDTRPAVIAVYTDDTQTTPRSADLMAGAAALTLSMEAAVMAWTSPDGPWDVPATDTDAETTLDLLDRQVRRALMDTDTPWGALWRTLVTEITALSSQRDAETDADPQADTGVRLARRRLVMQVTTLAEPRPGHIASGVWADLLALLEADTTGLAPLAPILRAEIEGTVPMPRPTAWPSHWEHHAAEALGHETDDPQPITGPIETIVTHSAGYPNP